MAYVDVNLGNPGNGNWYLRLYLTQESQSTSGNSSVVRRRATLRHETNNSVYGWTCTSGSVTIAGNTASIAGSHSGAEHNIYNDTATIAHGSDGKKYYSYSGSLTSTYILSGSGSVGLTLTDIPRATTPTITYTDSGKFGSGITVSLPRASTAFTHTVSYNFGGSSGTIATGATTSASWVIPLALANQIPNAVSGTGSITVVTYNGSTNIGSKSATITLRCTDDMIPSFSSISLVRVDNGVPSSWEIYVKNYSKATLEIIGAAGSYSSTITAYSITGGGYTVNSSTGTLGPFLNAGTNTFTATITDSRGRTASKTTSISVVDYSNPTLTLRAVRCTSDGTEVVSGQYVKITPTYSIASVGGKNAVVSKLFQIEGTSYSNTTCASGSSVVLGANTISQNLEYTVSGKIADALNQVAITTKVPISTTPFNIPANKGGVAIGGMYDNTITVDGKPSVMQFYSTALDRMIPIEILLYEDTTPFEVNGTSTSIKKLTGG